MLIGDFIPQSSFADRDIDRSYVDTRPDREILYLCSDSCDHFEPVAEEEFPLGTVFVGAEESV